MQPRLYQEEHIAKIVSSTKRKTLVQLPTGAGKTVEFAMITKKYVYEHKKSVLILVHRQELMYQASRTIKVITGMDACLITADTNRSYLAQVYIGMVESTVRRLDVFSNVGLVIIDECHIANFNKVHALFPDEQILGFSATPKSTSKKHPLKDYYETIVSGPQINELITDRYLAQNITRCPKDVVDSTQFEVDKLKDDYKEKQMAMEYSKPKHITNVVKNYEKYCFGTKTIIFNVNIEHSKQVTACLVLCGFNAKHLDSNSDDREEILQWFKDTEDAILCNVMIATVGFDEPTIKNVILNFSTLSLVKFIQCAGRGSRSLEDKHYFNIIDMGGNCIRFGDWNDDRNWDDIFWRPAKYRPGIAPVKTCKKCEGLVHASVRVCPLLMADGSFCLYEFEKKKVAEEQETGELVLITKNVDIDYLMEKNNKKYEYYTFFEIADDIVAQMYEKYPYPTEATINKYFREYYKLCIAWYNKYLAGKDGNISDISTSAWHIRRAYNHFNNLVKQKSQGAKIIPISDYSLAKTSK